MKRVLTIFATVVILFGAGNAPSASTAAAQTSGDTYADYTRMFERSAGQHWSDGSAEGQWAWEPQSTTESHIQWGHPADWPPTYTERFLVDREAGWVLLDGWWDNSTYYEIDVSRQWVADEDCTTNRKTLPGGRQRYARWGVPEVGEGYCLFAQGVLIERSSGVEVGFTHQQVWTNVGMTPNPYDHLDAAPALRQSEQWWDDNGHPYRLVVDRDVHIAKGSGMAWRIDDHRTGETAHLKYAWNY